VYRNKNQETLQGTLLSVTGDLTFPVLRIFHFHVIIILMMYKNTYIFGSFVHLTDVYMASSANEYMILNPGDNF